MALKGRVSRLGAGALTTSSVTGQHNATNSLVNEIIRASKDLHLSGTLSRRAYRSLARHLSARRVDYSAETGAGASTLLFSQLSSHHTVFALDGGCGSVNNVRVSPFLKTTTTTFVEGPTQTTLPSYRFDHALQAALLDGPHAYPFPELEYYYLYPHLEEGALLVIDDIQIRSVYNLFCFLKAEEMFELIEVVGKTAFFRRTSVPVFCPTGDEWWTQGYNKWPILRAVWREALGWPLPELFKSSLKYLLRRANVFAQRS